MREGGVKSYRKKPVVIQAVQWTGRNAGLIQAFGGEAVESYHIGGQLKIGTLEGTINASPGDYIIKGVEGEIYPCKPGIFEQTYEVANG